MNIAKNNVALLVHSCDRYAFLFKGFEHFFLKHWSFDIACNYYFATEEASVNIQGFTNIQSGKGEWANRLVYLLKEEIKEEYVLYFQEDMWLKSDVNKHFFAQIFALAKQHRWKQVKLHSSEVYKTISTGYYIDGFEIAKLDNAASDYLMSHQVTLWDKQFLLQQLTENEHPWRNERRGTKRLKKLNPTIYQIDYFAENGKPPINNNQQPIGRSGYNTVSVNGMLNISVEPFIKELANGSESDKDYAQQLHHHYTNNLTHDGNPQPRKEGFFKKLKKKLKG